MHLRREVREFLSGDPAMRSTLSDSWMVYDAEFSRRLGTRGWIGMTWPKRYGGYERSLLERYVVLEELLAAGAPVAAHWFADRQVGPMLLRVGTDAQKGTLLPGIAEGRTCFCIGMSEPNSGSDLASVRTRARETADAWIISGRKIWVSYAHHAQFMLLFCRTRDRATNRHEGFSHFVVPMDTPGISVRPIENLAGEHDFCEVVLEDVSVPRQSLLGVEGAGWTQVMHELAFERSGPERFLSTFVLLQAVVKHVAARSPAAAAAQVGRLFGHLWTLRRMSISVAGMLSGQTAPDVEAAIVKDLGTTFEQEVIEVVRSLIDEEPALGEGAGALAQQLGHAVLHAPLFSLRGGTREILRTVISKSVAGK